MTTGFSWKALQAQLRQSEYLLPTDDVSSQRGIIATSAAILERIAIANARETGGTWTPQHVIERRIGRPARPVAPGAVCGAGPAGGALIVKKPPAPSQPRPGGSAVAIPNAGPAVIGSVVPARPAPAPVGGGDDWF